MKYHIRPRPDVSYNFKYHVMRDDRMVAAANTLWGARWYVWKLERNDRKIAEWEREHATKIR